MTTATMKQYVATLTASGSGVQQRAKINAVGTMFFVRQVLPAGMRVNVRLRGVELGGKSGDSVELSMSQNDKVVLPFAYDRIEVNNENAVAISIDVIFGDGDYVRPLPDLVNVSLSIAGANDQASPADEDLSAAGLQEVFPINLSRTMAILTAHVDNADNIRVGGADIGVAAGTPLAPGETVAIATRGSIFAIEEASTGTNLICLREEIVS